MSRTVQIVVNITPTEIAHGQHKSCYLCPAALAVRNATCDMFPKGSVIVTYGGIRVYEGEAGKSPWWYAEAPHSLRTFIDTFDRLGTPEPLSIPVTLVKQAI